MRGALVALSAVAVALSGCATSSDAGASVDEAVNESATVDGLVDDLNGYWASIDDDLGFVFEPVPDSRISDGTDGVTCDGGVVAGEDIDDNAFVDDSCREGLTVGFDPDYADPGRELELALTFAHEWGHVAQAQAPTLDFYELDGLAIDAELQADCFAGAWAAEARAEDRDELEVMMLDLGDELHVPIDDPDAHGTPDERLDAFVLGFDEGHTACASDDLLDLLPS